MIKKFFSSLAFALITLPIFSCVNEEERGEIPCSFCDLNTPDNVITTANSTNSISISWPSVSDAIGYYIYRGINADGPYVQVGTSATTSYEDINLSADTAYYYKVAAYSSTGTGFQSGYVYVLNAPNSVIATVNSENSITVSWSAVSDAIGYHIYRSASIYGTYTRVGTSTATSYTNTSISSGAIYYYKIAAYNSWGAGLQSSYVYVLDTPIGVTAAANSENSIIVSWSAVSDAAGYYIYRSESTYGTYAIIDSTVSGTTSHTDTSLSVGAIYYYKIAAYNSVGIGNQSSHVSATTQAAPDNVIAKTNSVSSVIVNWDSVPGATEYYIYRSTSANDTYTQIGTSTKTSYINTSLSVGAIYYYKVAAYNSGWIGAQSSYASATTLSAPANIIATTNSLSSITVDWDTVSNATGYYIYRSESTNSAYTLLDSTAYTITSYTDISLSVSVAYYYKIAAYNNGGIGIQSSHVSAATLPAPSNVTATADSGSIIVNWSAVSGVTGYYIYRNENDSDTAYTKVGTSTTTLYRDNNTSSDTTYYYKIAAYSNVGAGLQSSNAYATALPSICDGQTYRTTVIGTQTWMAENLNCNVVGSVCYDNEDANCETYGRLYDWATAMGLDSSCSSTSCSDQMSSKRKGICPSGWHVPSDAEWQTLIDYAGGSSAAARSLKSMNIWHIFYNGTDAFGFSALPGGLGYSGSLFNVINDGGYWWTASEGNAYSAYLQNIGNGNSVGKDLFNKGHLLSVRCLKD